MSEHPSLVMQKPSLVVQKPSAQTLEKIDKQLKEIVEQVGMAKAFPLVLVDSQKIAAIIESTALTYREAITEILENFEKMGVNQVKEAFEQTNQQFEGVLAKLQVLATYLEKLTANAELEREVLTQLKIRLAES